MNLAHLNRFLPFLAERLVADDYGEAEHLQHASIDSVMVN
jgi:hypothetical protein